MSFSAISMSKTSMPANFLKRTALPSITGLRGERADIAEAEYRGAVGDDRDEILADREFRLPRCGSATIASRRRRRQVNRQAPDRAAWRGASSPDDLELARSRRAMVDERARCQVRCDGFNHGPTFHRNFLHEIGGPPPKSTSTKRKRAIGQSKAFFLVLPKAAASHPRRVVVEGGGARPERKAALVTEPACPCREGALLPRRSEAVTMRAPSGETAAVVTQPACPRRDVISCPAASYTRAMSSSEAVVQGRGRSTSARWRSARRRSAPSIPIRRRASTISPAAGSPVPGSGPLCPCPAQIGPDPAEDEPNL